MDSGTISDICNITITKSWLNRKRDRKLQNLFAQNSFIIISSSPKIRKSPIVKFSREEDFRVSQFATYRPIWQPWIQARPWYCQLERSFTNISWWLDYLTQNVGQLSAVHMVSYYFWRYTSFSPKLLKIGPIFIWIFFISMTWQINSLKGWHSSCITR